MRKYIDCTLRAVICFSRRYDFEYCHVFYNEWDCCNAVEFFDESELYYERKNLFQLNINEVKNLFPDIVEEFGCYISKDYSIGISVELGKIESILIGCKDYYQ